MNNFKGYNSINSISNLNGYISNIENEKIILWEDNSKLKLMDKNIYILRE